MRRIFLIASIGFILFFGSYSYYDRMLRTTLIIDEALNAKEEIGTPSRVEKEYKVSLVVPENERPQILNTLLYKILNTIVEANIWSAPPFFNQKYFVTSSEDTFIFRDIYFDTNDCLLDMHNSLLRLRWRWDDDHSYKQYIKGSYSPSSRPTRVEIQSKIGRQEAADGFSIVYEARMEFSKNAYPIKKFFDEGQAHLLLPYFFETVKVGMFEKKFHTPARSISSQIKKYSATTSAIQLVPQIVIVAKRHRYHLNLITPFGSGPNPNNAFIITIDRYTGHKLQFNSRNEKDLFSQSLQPKKELVEIEIEFERNTSTKIEQEINSNQTTSDKIEKIQKKFKKDHETLTQQIFRALDSAGYQPNPKNVSKLRTIKNLSLAP